MDEVETTFWADKLAESLMNRKKFNYLDKKVSYSKHVIKSSTSISGVPHVGNASDVFRAEAVVTALRDKGEKVRFIWVAEDMDPLRKVPAGIPERFKEFIGRPVSELPCPENCCNSYSDHFVTLFTDSLKDKFGVDFEVLWTSKEYQKGNFYEQIKVAIENVSKIREIQNKYKQHPLPENWIPYKPVCEKCGKIITTVMTGLEGENITYKCLDYKFAHALVKGCGHEGVSDIRKGFGKLLWKIEWAAEWHAWKVNFEPFGKEHGVNCPHDEKTGSIIGAGSFWVAGTISELVYDWPEPNPTKGPNHIQPYEYILIGKEKMSASKGNNIATWDWPKLAPPECLKLFFLRKPGAQQNLMEIQKNKDGTFKIIDKNFDIPKLFQEMEMLRRIYYGLEQTEKRSQFKKRLYRTCQVGPIPDQIPLKLPFRFAINMTQFDQIMTWERILKKSSELLKKIYGVKKILPEHVVECEITLNQARYWLEHHAPEKAKFKITAEIPAAEFSEKQKAGIRELIQVLLEKDWDEQGLQNKIFEIGKNIVGNPKTLFQAIYMALIGQKYGPRLAPFLLSLEMEWVIQRLKRVS